MYIDSLFMRDKIKNYLILGMAIVIALLFVFKGCGDSKRTDVGVGIKPELIKQDSFRTVIKWVDSVRVKEIVKWRNMTRITDSVKCYTEIIPFIQACDTIIKIDSVEIASLKGLVKLDSVVQVKLIVLLDSVVQVNKSLNKKVKRNRTLAKLAFVTGLFGGGALGVKISK